MKEIRAKQEIKESKKREYRGYVYSEETKYKNVRGGAGLKKCAAGVYNPQKLGLSTWAVRLKHLREINNLSQSDVAKVIRCSQVSYGMYELGKRRIPVDKLIVLAMYYRVSMDYMTGLTDKC